MSAIAGDSLYEDEDEGEPIHLGDARIRVLPDPTEVFVADQPWLARVLHPLVAIDLAALDPSLQGWVPLLSPVEPEDGQLGEGGAAHHGDWTGPDWLSFRIEDGGRLRFLGERRCFGIEQAEPAEGLAEHYAQAEREFAGTRARTAALGRLVWGDAQHPERQREGWSAELPVVDHLGGEPGYGNWATNPPPPALRLDEGDEHRPVLRLADGRPFRFVAATSGYPWREQGADAILLFVEPETRTLVLTLDWS